MLTLYQYEADLQIHNLNSVYAVMGISKSEDDEQLYVYNAQHMSVPYIFRPNEANIIDDYIPPEWQTVESDGATVTSFTEWASDPKYGNYLVEDDYYVEEGKWAWKIFKEEYQKLVEYYAIKYAGSVAEAKEMIYQEAMRKDAQLVKDRGWEPNEWIRHK